MSLTLPVVELWLAVYCHRLLGESDHSYVQLEWQGSRQNKLPKPVKLRPAGLNFTGFGVLNHKDEDRALALARHDKQERFGLLAHPV